MTDPQAAAFYVIQQGGASRPVLLLGPYATDTEAAANVERAYQYVLDTARTGWSFLGVSAARCRAKPGRTLPPGTLNGRIGLTAAPREDLP